MFNEILSVTLWSKAITMDNMIDLNLPLEAIIKAKLAFDKAKADMEYKSAMALLSGISGSADILPPIVKTKAPEESNLTLDLTLVGTKAKKHTAVMPQDVVKPLVIEYLSKNPGRHVTTDIFDYIRQVKALSGLTKDQRREWVTGISLALNTMSKGSHPQVRKTDTDNGNIKAYEWIGD